jgi:hypothetical protein
MQTLTAVLDQLKKEQTRLSSQLQHVSVALAALGGVTNGNRGGTMSAAGRARIAAALLLGIIKARDRILHTSEREICNYLAY